MEHGLERSDPNKIYRGSPDALLARALDGAALRAGSFIVTLYGDVVEPRGGRLWMGNIIETCASVGISESLVRTAVSRLVAAGQLDGEREGRLSFYRLTDAAQQEFLRAARILFDPTRPEGWRIVWLPPDKAETAGPGLDRAGFARLAAGWWIGPARDDADGSAEVAPGVVFDAAGRGEPALLRALAAAHWDLAAHAGSYLDFSARFEPVNAALGAGLVLEPVQALQLRLVLVHLFRHVALRDPRLPDAALPPDWPGRPARALFARLYRALSPLADRHVGERFQSQAGALCAVSPTTERRIAALEQDAAGA